MDDVLRQVGERIQRLKISPKEAALQIGVTADSLSRHLSGEYVRSDSLAKYRAWLAGTTPVKARRQSSPRQVPLPDAAWSAETGGMTASRELPPFEVAGSANGRHAVVDLFSGCGGLSLGFDLYREGTVFRTVLAFDIEEPMARVYNHNLSPVESGETAICRQIDLSDFRNEAEVLAFYLDHLAQGDPQGGLPRQLEALPGPGLGRFKATIARLDRDYLARLAQIRASPDFREAYSRLSPNVLGQTSVKGFHAALGLPPVTGRPTTPGPIIWSDITVSDDEGFRAAGDDLVPGIVGLTERLRGEAEQGWDEAIAGLRKKAAATGKGQLASSARRIAEFLRFLDSDAMVRMRRVWLDWRTARDASRSLMFDGDAIHRALLAIYSGDRRVAVVLGGPPCQGFSRIGRGKIRSLRDHGVQVHVDAEAGDLRNRLLYAYVQFVSALAPAVFLFENVRHFQAEVRTPEGTFLASEVLAEAIREVSAAGLDYRVATRVVDFSQHLIPQKRERFVMVGVRADIDAVASNMLPEGVARWCLELPRREPIALAVPLGGLPQPYTIGEADNGSGNLSRPVKSSLAGGEPGSATRAYIDWISRPAPHGPTTPAAGGVDGHCIRAPRADDRAFFELLGPGKRWMDYRCDNSPTLNDLAALVEILRQMVAMLREHPDGTHPALTLLAGVPPERLDRIREALDGSLSLRLLLESIEPLHGELAHHLLTPGYLGKREGNHGDWLARLHPDRPSKTIVSHMAKDTYSFVHPSQPRTLSVREAARIQAFPDWYRFGVLGFVDAFRVIGNAVPPLLSFQFADRVARVLQVSETSVESISSLHEATIQYEAVT